MNRGRRTITTTVVVVTWALFLVSGCAAKAKPTSPCPSASAAAAAYIAQAQIPPSPPALVPIPQSTGTTLSDVLDQLDARTRNQDAIQTASAAAASASEQAKLLAAYVEVQHASCFSDADIAQAQLWIDHFK